MDHSPRVKELFLKCEEKAKELKFYCSKHQLLTYDLTGMPEDEAEATTQRFFRLFGPKEMNRVAPTDDDMYHTLYAFFYELCTAITLEKARSQKPALGELYLLLKECESKCDVLHAYNQNHPLLRLAGKNMSTERYSERNRLVVSNYTSYLKNVTRELTARELIFAYEEYLSDIESAIAIEHARFQARTAQK